MSLSIFGKDEKKYGLIIKKEEKTAPLKKLSAFNVDSEDEDEASKVKKINKSKKFVKMQVQLDIEKALMEDPKCFEYDDVYDQDHAKIEEEKVSVKKDLKPKYMSGLVKAAEKRKKHMEIVAERKLQKERDAEADQFEDKDSFVTGTYKETLKARREEEERERRQQVLEELIESKQDKDYTGFYKNILEQRLGENQPPPEESPKIVQQVEVHSDREINSSPERNDRKHVRRDDRRSDDESPKIHKRRRSRSSSPKRHRCRRSESSEERYPSKRSRRDRRSPNREKNRHESHRDVRSHDHEKSRREDRNDRRRRSPEHRRSVERQNESRKDKEKQVKEVVKEVAEIKTEDKKMKRNEGEVRDDARARYLARKAAESNKAVISKK